MRIAVIEDEKVHRDLMLSYLEKWSGEHREDEVDSFETAESFWFAYEENKCFDILFVDIQMPGMNGMELAKRIREKDRDIVIVFTTGITDYLEEGYEVEALHYLIKPLNEEKVRLCLEKARNRKQTLNYLTLHTEGETLKIREESVNYAEARGHGCILGMAGDGELAVKESLSELESLLGESSFVKCHRSYLCRIGNIHHIGKEEIVFDDGQSIPVSRRLYNEINKRFIEYFRREIFPEGNARCE